VLEGAAIDARGDSGRFDDEPPCAPRSSNAVGLLSERCPVLSGAAPRPPSARKETAFKKRLRQHRGSAETEFVFVIGGSTANETNLSPSPRSPSCPSHSSSSRSRSPSVAPTAATPRAALATSLFAPTSHPRMSSRRWTEARKSTSPTVTPCSWRSSTRSRPARVRSGSRSSSSPSRR
jgi:hypothetical protein